MKASELRWGNAVLQKVQHRIKMVPCTAESIALVEKGSKEVFPVVLKAEVLTGCGFTENMDYPLRPGAREFRLLLPVQASGEHAILAYIKNNNECFARAAVNGAVASNPVYQLHQLQNLYHALTGSELAVAGL